MSQHLPQCDSIAVRRLARVCLGLLAVLLLPVIVMAAEPMRLAVAGVSNETDQTEFSKLLISQGIAHLIAQALYDTGRYVPVEDNAEISGQIQTLVARAPISSEPSSEPSPLPESLTELGCDAVASARIVKFEKSRLRGFAGPFSSGKVDVSIEVEVSVQEHGKAAMKATGAGRGTTKARGALFQIREDQVHFDQTSVGKATQEAVTQAVAGLTDQMGEEP